MANSWYVEYIIRNATQIRDKAFLKEYTGLSEPAYTMEFDDELYNDLLLVESKIKELFGLKVLTEKQVDLLKYTSKGYNLSDIERITGISRITLSKNFSDLCDSIGYRLGGQFTDSGFTEYMQEKYSLDTEQLQKLINFLNSNKRHT